VTISFALETRSGAARAGRLTTAHGTVDTPVFMAVGTRGSVKGLRPRDLREVGVSVMLANTYHLMLRPGAAVVEAAGGLHAFAAWDGPMLTDSGGYQVFSLAERARVDDDGVTFRSTYDGAEVRLGPEQSMTVQRQLGADLVMAFDECVELPAPRERLVRALERTTRWAHRCRALPLQPHQALLGIVQGGDDLDLRARSARELLELELPGYAIGGLSVGEDLETFERVCRHTAAMLPEDRPRYLMGVGTPRDLVLAVEAGVDMFDCVLPTRNGRNAQAFTDAGPVRLRGAACATQPGPIEPGCSCPACQEGFSRAYLRHLFQVGEMLGPILASLHNLSYYQRLMRRMREAILAGGDALARLREQILIAYPPPACS
jgi:queuine tRNA-ribosyltransferase